MPATVQLHNFVKNDQINIVMRCSPEHLNLVTSTQLPTSEKSAMADKNIEGTTTEPAPTQNPASHPVSPHALPTIDILT